MTSRRLSAAIVGGGVVGSTLGRLLAEGGVRITAVVSRTTASARRAARFVGAPVASTSVASIPADTGVVYITTPHDAIAGVAREIALNGILDLPRTSVCHASGVHTAAVLDPCGLRGAATFSFHPLQTFPRDFRPADLIDDARGIAFGVDGGARGVMMARRLARAMGGKVVLIPPERRPLYHAACVVASNHLTTMLWILDDMARAAGMPAHSRLEAFGPILRTALKNGLATSPAESLSGPIARGGVGTVALHFEALAESAPHLIPYFAAVSEETVRLARARGSITRSAERALRDVIAAYQRGEHSREEPS